MSEARGTYHLMEVRCEQHDIATQVRFVADLVEEGKDGLRCLWRVREGWRAWGPFHRTPGGAATRDDVQRKGQDCQYQLIKRPDRVDARPLGSSALPRQLLCGQGYPREAPGPSVPFEVSDICTINGQVGPQALAD